VLKLFYNWFDTSSIEYEARIARAIHASGLSVPAVDGLVSVDGRRGLVYQRIDGGNMLEILWCKPWRASCYARMMADLHVEMHGKSAPADLPSQKQRLARNINRAEGLPGDIRSRALAALESMPDGDRLCHGDFHPGNILMTAGGGIVIDWIDATSGRPMADLARTTVIATGAVARQIDSALQRLVVRVLHSSYLRRYFRLRPDGEDEYRRWLPLVAAARVAEGIPELRGWLAGFAGARL
jgi:aminoglycoside phosphotransferase (APT) family kinase protein